VPNDYVIYSGYIAMVTYQWLQPSYKFCQKGGFKLFWGVLSGHRLVGKSGLWAYKICPKRGILSGQGGFKGVLVAFKDSDMKFSRLV
jgi:hypothetical protein